MCTSWKYKIKIKVNIITRVDKIFRKLLSYKSQNDILNKVTNLVYFLSFND